MHFEVIAPGIILYHDVLENPQRIIDIAKNSQDWEASRLAREYNGQEDTEYRNSRSIPVTTSLDSPLEWFELSKTIWDAGKHYASYFDIDFSRMENVQILHYENRGGFYKPHGDDSPFFPRIFSSVLYLNDVEEGGETEFTLLGIKVTPKAGSMVFFPANFAYKHQANIPVSGDKYVAVTWFTPVYLDSSGNPLL